MIIKVSQKGEIGVILEPEFCETLQVLVAHGEEEGGPISLGTHYPLKALSLRLPENQTFISDDGAFYILPLSIARDFLESLEWGEGEYRLVLKKWRVQDDLFAQKVEG